MAGEEDVEVVDVAAVGFGLADCNKDLEDSINSFEDAYAAFNAFSTESGTFEAVTAVSFDLVAIARFVKKPRRSICC